MARSHLWAFSLSAASALLQGADSWGPYCARMTLQSQVKVFAAGVASFGGTGLRRLGVNIGGQVRELLLHEDSGGVTPYLLAGAGTFAALSSLPLVAEWGEPLGQITELHSDEESGQIQAYGLILRGQTEGVVVQAADTYWWNGELFCRRRQAYHLRDLLRGKKMRVRAQAA